MPLTLNLISVSCKSKKKKTGVINIVSHHHWIDLVAVWIGGSHWEGEIVNTGCTSLRETRGDFWVIALYLVKRPNYYINLNSGTHTHMFKCCRSLISDVYSEYGIHREAPDKETYLKILTDVTKKLQLC